MCKWENEILVERELLNKKNTKLKCKHKHIKRPGSSYERQHEHFEFVNFLKGIVSMCH